MPKIALLLFKSNITDSPKTTLEVQEVPEFTYLLLHIPFRLVQVAMIICYRTSRVLCGHYGSDLSSLFEEVKPSLTRGYVVLESQPLIS